MRINTNLNAMKAIKNSNKNVSSSGNSMKKLISGLSINKAADDAAGLAIKQHSEQWCETACRWCCSDPEWFLSAV